MSDLDKILPLPDAVPQTPEDQEQARSTVQGNENPSRRRNRNILIGVGATAAAGALVVSALIGRSMGDNGEAAKNTPEPTPTSIGGPSTAGSETAAPQPTSSGSEVSNPGTGDTLSQTTTIETMDAMSVEEYAQLPFADRVAYAIAKVGEAYPVMSASDEVDPSMIPGWFWQQALGHASNNPSADERAKLAGSYDYYTTDKQTGALSEPYQNTINSVVSAGGEGIASGVLFIYEDSGNLQQGIDRNGNPIEFYNVTYHNENEVTGEVEPSQTAQAIKTEVTLLDGSLVVFYARGYGIDGHQSPVEDYPY